MQTNESNLTLATLIYATSCFEQGDWAVLRDLNFGEKEIKALETMQFADFLAISDRMDGHVLNIQLDRNRFWLILKEMRRERAVEKLKSALICREAPADMMRHLFGMNDRQYTVLRRRCRRGKRGAGRPAEPDIDTMNTIWRIWYDELDGQEPASADDWLKLSDATEADCRTLWRFIRGTNALERTS